MGNSYRRIIFRQLLVLHPAQETIRFFWPEIRMVDVITAEVLPVLGDRIQRQQVILNLVMNGIDAISLRARQP